MERDNPPPANRRPAAPNLQNGRNNNTAGGGFIDRVKSALSTKKDTSLRETLEEYIDERPGFSDPDSVSIEEKKLLSNILKLRSIEAVDAMVPRADIFAIEISTKKTELLKRLSQKQVSRIPVYRETLDDVLGTIHIKDVLAALAKNKEINIEKLITDVPIVSPSMPLLDVLLKMRQTQRHMVLVVDEFGGIDGLLTVGDVLEAIIGEIDDEHDNDEEPQITKQPDGSLIADARVDIDEFEEEYGQILSEEEREESDTLGGLVFLMAGRVPARGEVLTHDSGMILEIMEADPRRVSLVRIRNLPPFADLS